MGDPSLATYLDVNLELVMPNDHSDHVSGDVTCGMEGAYETGVSDSLQ